MLASFHYSPSPMELNIYKMPIPNKAYYLLIPLLILNHQCLLLKHLLIILCPYCNLFATIIIFNLMLLFYMLIILHKHVLLSRPNRHHHDHIIFIVHVFIFSPCFSPLLQWYCNHTSSCHLHFYFIIFHNYTSIFIFNTNYTLVHCHSCIEIFIN